MSTLSSLLLDRNRPAADAPASPAVPVVRSSTPVTGTAAAETLYELPSAGRLNSLRAGVLGANDGIVSVAATVVGVAGAATEVSALAIAGGAALVAGALSMAAGEYVSVSSQRDAERVMRTHGVLDEAAELTNPWHAAIASLAAFVVGGVVPLLVMLAPWGGGRIIATFAAVVVALTITGVVSARLGGARTGRAVLRNVLGGSIAMLVTYGIGTLVGLAL